MLLDASHLENFMKTRFAQSAIREFEADRLAEISARRGELEAQRGELVAQLHAEVEEFGPKIRQAVADFKKKGIDNNSLCFY